MTRGEAADFLEKCRWWFEPFTSEKEQWNEALDIAVEALTQESTQDLISRQDAIKNAHFPMIDDAGYEVVRVDDILALPSAEPKTKCVAQIRINRDDIEDLVNEKVNEIVETMSEPKTGEWVQDDDYICDQCGYHMIVGGGAYNYCPNCGARMLGKDDEG